MGKSAFITILTALLMLALWSPAFAQSAKSAKTPASSSASPGTLESKAKRAMEQGDYQTAIQEYSKLLQASPHSSALLFQLGTAYYAAGNPHAATQRLQEALKLNPKLAEARYFLGASLAETDRCSEAIPDLKHAVLHVPDRHMRLRMGIDGVNCSMELDRQDDAIEFLERLRRQFPKNAEVLYLSVHVFSDLSTRASQALLMSDPGSYQVHELNAEALATQGKWDKAEAEYRKVLAMKPDLPGIHYLIGRLILTKPKTATTFTDAKKEFEAELKIDPHNAGAQFVLGELALRSENYPEAITRFSKAASDDPTFAPAKIELGRALISIHQPAKAVAPLQSAVNLQPQNPSAHYLLAMAYRGAGQMQDARKELAAYQKATANAQRTNQKVQSGILGRKTPAQLSSHSQQSQH